MKKIVCLMLLLSSLLISSVIAQPTGGGGGGEVNASEQELLEERLIHGALGYVEQTNDTSIDEALLTNEWVRVNVVLKDTSNLTYVGRNSTQTRQDITDLRFQRNNNTRQSVLNSLSDSDFQVLKLFTNGRSFSGHVSSTGLTKLRNNSYVWSVRKPLAITIASESTDSEGGSDVSNNKTSTPKERDDAEKDASKESAVDEPEVGLEPVEQIPPPETKPNFLKKVISFIISIFT